MGYIDPPEPPDHVVIWEETETTPAFTWGDHRAMRKMLDELESENPAIKQAGARLQQALVDFGWVKEGRVVQICEYCNQPEDKPHEVECRDHNDPALWVKREALSYQYLDDKFVVLHTTSVPMTDEEALEYFGFVDVMFPDEVHPRYITRKGLTESKWTMMPFWYESIDGDVWPIEGVG